MPNQPMQSQFEARWGQWIQPEWMDDAEWELRDATGEPATVPAASTRLKRVLCEGATLSPAPTSTAATTADKHNMTGTGVESH